MIRAYSHREFKLFTLAAVRDVRIEREEVKGVLGNDDRRVYIRKPGELSQTFVNWKSDEASIVRFTLNYGAPYAHYQEDGQFSFHVEEWRKTQDAHKQLWNLWVELAHYGKASMRLDGNLLGKKQ